VTGRSESLMALLMLMILIGVTTGISMVVIGVISISSPYDRFQKDTTLVEYCYINITSVEDSPVKYSMETHMEKVYNYHEECINRNLNITSIGDMKQMETKKFGTYAFQGRVYVKFSTNDTKGLKYGDLI
jgi:hypothetical protein